MIITEPFPLFSLLLCLAFSAGPHGIMALYLFNMQDVLELCVMSALFFVSLSKIEINKKSISSTASGDSALACSACTHGDCFSVKLLQIYWEPEVQKNTTRLLCRFQYRKKTVHKIPDISSEWTAEEEVKCYVIKDVFEGRMRQGPAYVVVMYKDPCSSARTWLNGSPASRWSLPCSSRAAPS